MGNTRETAAHGNAASVSVVVATNRSSSFLREALESVAGQTLPPLEVIVVDDGSTDPDFIHRAVTVLPGSRVIRQEPSGVAVARNVGAAAAKGAFLVFLDDDDRWHAERLEYQVSALLEKPEAVAGYCAMQSIDEMGGVVAQADQVAVLDRLDIARRITGIILPNIMIRRSAFEDVGGFDPSLRLAEDLDLVLDLAARGPFAFSPELLVDYRSHPDNATKRHRELSAAIDRVVRDHLREATLDNDASLVSAHRESLRSNNRFAWWSALRSARTATEHRKFLAAVSEIGWAIRFAPTGAPDALIRRLRRSH